MSRYRWSGSNWSGTILVGSSMLRVPGNVSHEDVSRVADRVRDDKALHQPAVFFTAQPVDDFVIGWVPGPE